MEEALTNVNLLFNSINSIDAVERSIVAMGTAAGFISGLEAAYLAERKHLIHLNTKARVGIYLAGIGFMTAFGALITIYKAI